MLADTGQVSLAAKAVGMSRESAYKLRRAPHAAAIARAWDAARHHAGSFLEDVAFERAIEGVEHNVFNEYGEVICTKRVVSDRLLMYLLRHLKPERYAADALAKAAPPPPEPVEASLRALEPLPPAPPEQLLAPNSSRPSWNSRTSPTASCPTSSPSRGPPNRPSGKRRRRGLRR